MYSDEAINDISKLIKQGAMGDQRYMSTIKMTKQGINNTQKFHLGYLSDYSHILETMYMDGLFQKENGINVKAPYREMWFDYNVDIGSAQTEHTEDESSKRGIYVCELFPDVLLCHIINYLDVDRRWMPGLQMHIYLINDIFENRPDALSFITGRWIPSEATTDLLRTIRKNNYAFIPVSDHLINMGNASDKGAKTAMNLLDEDRHELSILNMALRLLCCKNIITEDIQPTRKVRRKKRMFDIPDKRRFTYKVLNIEVPKTRKKTNKTYEPSGAHNRVHFCRGHFKTYTEDAPLFGKYTGTYWWEPTVRGTSDMGPAFKTYSVEPKQL